MGRHVKDYKIIKRFREKEIYAEIRLLDDGSVNILLSGGDRSHIGAVYIRNEKKEIVKHSFEGHKDYVLAEQWMEELGTVASGSLVISVGIHYDNISLKEIEKIQEISREMLKEGYLFIEIGGSFHEENN